MATRSSATGTACPKCGTAYPEIAHFCAKCGTDVRAGSPAGHGRKGVFAAHPGEPAWSVNLMSTLMPLASASTLQTYRFALVLALGVPVVAALLGFLPFAFAAAAVAVPFVFLLYLRDVNQWEDEPLPVIFGTVMLAGLFAAGFTLLWRDNFINGPLSFIPTGQSTFVDWHVLLMVALVVPIVSEVLKEIGPLVLASRQRFDDLIDGVTFGVVAGAAYATVETFVLNSGVVFSGPERIHHPNGAVWVSIIVVAGLLKPVIYGAASGLAVGAWSGVGKGYRGLGGPYLKGLAEAILANVVFQGGLYLTGRFGGTVGTTLGLAFSLVLAGILVLRLRFVLHTALLEEALEAANRGEAGIAASQGDAYCANCDLPLLEGASFCVSCGMAVRAASKLTRQANSAPTPGARAGGKSFPAPALAGWGAAETPQGTRHSTRSIVIAAVALVALMGGAFAALNAATRPSKTISKIVSNSSSRSQSRSVGARLSLPPQQNTGAAGGSGVPAVKLANGVVVPVPDGWKVGGHGNVTAKKKKIGNWVQVGTDGAVVEVDSFKIKSGAAADLAQVFLNNVVSQQFQDIQLGSKSGPVQVQGVNADAYDTYFQGTVANDQGSVTVDGVFRTFVTSGHKVVIFEQANATGQFDTFKNDFGLIYTGVEGTLPS